MFKFMFGPITGEFNGLPMWLTIPVSVAGMMTSVLVFSYIGEKLQQIWVTRFRPASKRFSKRNRIIVSVWGKFGLGGLAFLTPLLLSPMVGTILAVSFGESRKRILGAMFVSALFWGIALTVGIHAFGNRVQNMQGAGPGQQTTALVSKF